MRSGKMGDRYAPDIFVGYGGDNPTYKVAYFTPKGSFDTAESYNAKSDKQQNIMKNWHAELGKDNIEDQLGELPHDGSMTLEIQLKNEEQKQSRKRDERAEGARHCTPPPRAKEEEHKPDKTEKKEPGPMTAAAAAWVRRNAAALHWETGTCTKTEQRQKRQGRPGGNSRLRKKSSRKNLALQQLGREARGQRNKGNQRKRPGTKSQRRRARRLTRKTTPAAKKLKKTPSAAPKHKAGGTMSSSSSTELAGADTSICNTRAAPSGGNKRAKSSGAREEGTDPKRSRKETLSAMIAKHMRDREEPAYHCLATTTIRRKDAPGPVCDAGRKRN